MDRLECSVHPVNRIDGDLVPPTRTDDRRLAVLLVDDNEHVAQALRLKITRSVSFGFAGWLPDAGALSEWAFSHAPDMAVVDIDMPGPDIFEVMSRLTSHGVAIRFVVFSGLVTRELIDRAIDSGAWGYVSKNDGEHELLDVLRAVASGEVAFSTEARVACETG